MGFIDKYNNWKHNKHAKFREQNSYSRETTKQDSKDIVSALKNEKKLNTFAYEFAKPYHKNWLVHLKSVNFFSIILLGFLLLSNIVFYGLLKNINLVSPDMPNPTQFDKLNLTSWVGFFVPICVTAVFFAAYIIGHIIVKIKRNKKFNNSETYKYYYNENLVFRIIMIVALLFSFFAVYPKFSFSPIILLQMLEFNPATGKILLIFSFIIQILTFLTYLVFASSTIACYACNPKFNIDLLTNTNK